MFSSLLSFALLSLTLPYAAVASSHAHVNHHRHDAIAAALNTTTEHTLERRETYNNARLTYYAVGLGACGKTNVPSDFIVALNSGMYGNGYPGPNCFRPIAITYNGQTVDATIMDECPGCPSDGGLDLSEGLFSALAPLSEGVLYASWRFTDEGDGDSGSSGNDQPTTTSEKPKTTSTPPPPPPTTHKETPTSTWEPPKTTSTTHSTTPTPTPTPTTHSTTSTEHSTTTSHTTSKPPPTTTSQLSSSSTTSSAPAVTTSAGPDTLAKLNQAFIGLNEMVLAGAQAA